VYFAGDTGLFPEMSHLGPIDSALLPVGGWGPWLRGGHLDHVRATEALRRIRPASALPIHWGTYWPMGMRRSWRFTDPGARFAAEAEAVVPDVDVRVVQVGERVAVPAIGAATR
jgi:L-ascorbate metabolism protein UlaG (beta-lactamase superfamily)